MRAPPIGLAFPDLLGSTGEGCKIPGRANGASDAACFEAHDVACIRGERPVFSGVSFRLEPGDALTLVGPNGAGKSSLLRILAGLLRAAGGTLSWDGAPLDDDWAAHRERLHYVGHLDAVKPTLTVAENLDGWARFKGAARAAPDALATLGIEDLADVPGRYLSAGQRRRLALARVLATPAPLWLLDEPTVTLDAERGRPRRRHDRRAPGRWRHGDRGDPWGDRARRCPASRPRQPRITADMLLAGQEPGPEDEEW